MSVSVWRKSLSYCSTHGNRNSWTAWYCSWGIHQIRKDEEISVWDKLKWFLHFLLGLKHTFICWKWTCFTVADVVLLFLNWDILLKGLDSEHIAVFHWCFQHFVFPKVFKTTNLESDRGLWFATIIKPVGQCTQLSSVAMVI